VKRSSAQLRFGIVILPAAALCAYRVVSGSRNVLQHLSVSRMAEFKEIR
jgi:hypothetical protein